MKLEKRKNNQNNLENGANIHTSFKVCNTYATVGVNVTNRSVHWHYFKNGEIIYHFMFLWTF